MLGNAVGIVVTSPTGDTDVIVEVKLTRDLDAATGQLCRYMRRVGVPVGLLVGRETIRLLREMYRGEPSVQVIGEFPVALASGLVPSDDPVEYEDRVQRWLESLGDGQEVADEPLRSALLEHVVPAIENGTVRAGGPRRDRISH
jgi:hypothetical protein